MSAANRHRSCDSLDLARHGSAKGYPEWQFDTDRATDGRTHGARVAFHLPIDHSIHSRHSNGDRRHLQLSFGLVLSRPVSVSGRIQSL